jgi:hypothetical protein
MKRRILATVLGLMVLSQVPFAYRRYRLSRIHDAIEQLALQRTAPPAESEYVDYKGVIHVHSSLGGHSTGNFAEIISAAKANQLDFVIMTEHPASDFDTSTMTLAGVHAGVLFINGNEVATVSGDRLLLIPGSANAAAMSAQSTAAVVEKQRTFAGLTFAAYPAESQNWQSSPIEGVEVYNLFTNAQAANRFALFFDGLWSYGWYPELMFANFFARPDENLRRWDEAIMASNHKLVAIGGNDAHSNVGLSVNDASGKQWLGVKLDPYERSFRVVRTHVLIRRGIELSRESLLEALSQGHCYLSFDLFADGNGFSFAAIGPEHAVMGDEVPLANGLHLVVDSPIASRIVLIKDGNIVDQRRGSGEFQVTAKGSYRVELYLDSLPGPVNSQPWIISNPIYVR